MLDQRVAVQDRVCNSRREVHTKRRYCVRLASGKLAIETEFERVPLDDVLEYGSRENPKRAFIFVSKIVGKYVPVVPRKKRFILDMLARRIGNVRGPVLVIGLAEVATSLGHGVQESYRALHERDDVLYMHTTRYPLRHPIALHFEESHSHAMQQALHMPLDEYRGMFLNAKTLVLVDDEITTGRTNAKLIREYLRLNPSIEEVVCLTILDWMDEEHINELFKTTGRDVRVEALIRGRCRFEPNPAYVAVLPPGTDVQRREAIPGRYDAGRLGIMTTNMAGYAAFRELLEVDTSVPVLILGTGEFTYLPFLLAEQLEHLGVDVLFQSTARNPLALGNAIKSKLSFSCHHGEGVPYYLYNMPLGRKVYVGYETEALARSHHSLQNLICPEVFVLGEPMHLFRRLT